MTQRGLVLHHSRPISHTTESNIPGEHGLGALARYIRASLEAPFSINQSLGNISKIWRSGEISIEMLSANLILKMRDRRLAAIDAIFGPIHLNSRNRHITSVHEGTPFQRSPTLP